MNNKSAHILSFLLFITIFFFPILSSGEPSQSSKKSGQEKITSNSTLEGAKLNRIERFHEKTGTRLRKYISRWKAESASLRSKTGKSTAHIAGKVRLVLKTKDDAGRLSSNIKKYGGRIIWKHHNYTAVEVPANKVEQMVEENDAIEYARLPFKFHPFGYASQGVDLTGANLIQDTIYKGAGVKVAVIDVGFKGLSDAISNGALPADVITHDFSGKGLQTEYKHGTACAEIVHDMAPDAQLYLLKLGDEIDSYDVVDYCINNGINIVSLSIGTFGSGPGDGTGPVDDAFDGLRKAGILVVAAAGNYGNYSLDGITIGFHWEGTFRDTNGDLEHEFRSYDPNSYYNVIAAYPTTNDDGTPETDEVTIVMRWNDWPDSDIDYNMYLYDYDYKTAKIGNLVASSENLQTGTQPPEEWIIMDVPNNEDYTHYYALVVKRRDAETPTGIKLEIYLGGTSAFVPFGDDPLSAIATSGSSIAEPADAESVLAVGAINYANWKTGPQEGYSSEGPTNDWNGSAARIKPDIMGPDNVSTYTYGVSSFPGTSAATPHVAGLAALVLSMDPGMTADELQTFLEEHAVDMGDPGKDNIYGWGRLKATLLGYPVKSYQKISHTEGNFTGELDSYDNFGSSVTSIGDLNGDGTIDLAVGAPGNDGNKGAVWILFMNTDGTVKSYQKISDTEGNFTGTLNNDDNFGSSVTSIGDLNGDGTIDLAVGAPGDDGNKGAVWILFMNADGTVKSYQKISDTEGDFTGTLNNGYNFGSSIASIGDLNGDGIGDLAIGAPGDIDGDGYRNGAVWILFMNSDGTVKTYQKISDTEGNFTGTLGNTEFFGSSVTAIGDLNGDGIEDLAVGAPGDNDGGDSRGAVWILFMNNDGTVQSCQKISDTEGNFTGTLDNDDNFGSSLSSAGDLNGDGIKDLVVGASQDDDGGTYRGAAWILFMNNDGTVQSCQKISDTEGNFTGTLDNSDFFGKAVSSVGDLNGDGTIDLVVGAPGDTDGDSYQSGAVWILFLNPYPADRDNDGMPDYWEIKYGLNPDINDAAEDPDNDGLTNIEEYRAGTDPTNPDTDGDGMPDGWEVKYGLNPLVNDAAGDLDGDGFTNLQEYLKGTNPDDAKSHPPRTMPWLQLLLGDK